MRDYYNLILLALMSVGILAYASEVLAQSGDDDSAGEPATPAGVDTSDLMDPDAAVETEDLVEGVEGIEANIKAIQDAESQTAKALAIMALIATVLKLLLDGLRRYGQVLLGKKEVRIACLVAGAVIFLLSYLATGTEWFNAVLLALGGPGAILVTELTKLAKTTEEK